MSKKVNLNADLGESFGMYTMGNDEKMLDIISSANIACGFHASDPLVMTQTVKLAAAKNVSIGAHPSFPDLQGFGRRNMHIPSKELSAMIVYQIGALAGIAKAHGQQVTHVKPHGALYNMASVDADISQAIVEAVHAYDPNMILMTGAGSLLYHASIQAGLPTAGEIFADRTYDENGNLTPRS